MSGDARKLSDPLLSQSQSGGGTGTGVGAAAGPGARALAEQQLTIAGGAESELTRRFGGGARGTKNKRAEGRGPRAVVGRSKASGGGGGGSGSSDGGAATSGAARAAAAAAADREHSSRFGAHIAVATGSLVSIMKPVALTMLLAAFAVGNVRNASNAAITQGLSSYMVYKDVGGGGGGGGGGG